MIFIGFVDSFENILMATEPERPHPNTIKNMKLSGNVLHRTVVFFVVKVLI